jgi:transcriptional regulator with XRE-family HTH domain
MTAKVYTVLMLKVYSKNRLQLAMTDAEYSLDALASDTGISSRTIRRAMKGDVAPDTKTLTLLADKLRVDIGFFFAEPPKRQTLF